MSTAAEPRFRFAPILAATVATFLLFILFWKVADILLILFVAVLLSMYLGSVTDFLVSRLSFPRGVAFTAAVLLTLGAIGALGAVLVPPVVEQTRQLLSVLPDYLRTWQEALARLLANYPLLGDATPQRDELVNAVMTQVQGALGRLFPTVINVGHALVVVVSILVMGIYLALYPGLYREWLIALFPPVHRDLVRDVLRDMRDTLRAWIIAQL
ncbi:MAG TPA: AI-2E family transporter, partial [Gemmatimonadaceae bacterium]